MSSLRHVSSNGAAAYATPKQLPRFPRILCIQSTVAHGYVGNKCATFPLQCLGFHVDAINTVSLSNHPDYTGGFKGQFLSVNDMVATISGLQANDLLSQADCILTGYMRSTQVLEVIESTIKAVQQTNPDALYVCDPVLGDNGSYYVPEELREFYKTRLIPLAYAVTPNYFETEVLTGIAVRTVSDAKRACAVFHSWGVQVCVLKGLRLANEETGPLSVLLSIQPREGEAGESCLLRRDVPRVGGNFSGCGDLFTALMVTGLYRARAELSSVSSISSGGRHTDLAQVLGTVLDGVTGTMSAVVAETAASGGRELHIIESMEQYRQLHVTWGDLHKAGSAIDPGMPHEPGATMEAGGVGGDRNVLKRSFVQRSTRVSGVCFDMDGTLTEPGAIDFSQMYARNRLDRAAGDILTQIGKMEPAAQKGAMDIVMEEEARGCERMALRPRVRELLHALRRGRIRTALSTRNCMMAYERFMALLQCSDETFYPALTRDCLGGINKPDPEVGRHILQAWEIEAHESGSVWFVGDSEDDMICGSLAGFKTCLLRTHYNREFAALRPECVSLEVDSLEEFALVVLNVVL